MAKWVFWKLRWPLALLFGVVLLYFVWPQFQLILGDLLAAFRARAAG